MIEILTAILVIITGFYAWVTFQMFKAMRRDTDEAMRPYVYFDFVYDAPMIEGHLRNVGRTAAYNIDIKLDPQVKVSARSGNRVASLISRTTTFLAPGRDVQEFLGNWDEVTSGKTKNIFEGTVTYENCEGKKYSEDFRIDVSSREGMLHLARAKTSEELKKLNDQIDKLIRAVERRNYSPIEDPPALPGMLSEFDLSGNPSLLFGLCCTSRAVARVGSFGSNDRIGRTMK